ncbi:MAG: DJ-1/PfpI family protein, partial [Anaerolineae bacterium]|nr:DJ-1/PfpI family protein [Anaerolineae bacterium]
MRNVAILLFDEVEVLDFAGPFEVFSVAARVNGEPPVLNVYTVARQNTVSTRGGLRVTPHYTLADCPRPDILLVPGGWGTRPLLHDAALLEWIARQAEGLELLLSVCTGALLLGKAGLLDGLRATTHHSAFGLLREHAPAALVVEDERFVDNGRVITSGGISAGIDMALHVVARLLGAE